MNESYIERLNQFIDNMSEMVVIHELIRDDSGNAVDYRIVDCNRAFEEITGIERKHASGKKASEVYQSDTAPYLQEFSSVVVTGEPDHLSTYYPPMDKHFVISIVPIGQNGFATITLDVTESKCSEMAIEKLNTQLKAKNEELEQVIYVASHDLRSPLVNIDGYGRELEFIFEDMEAILQNKNISREELSNSIKKQFDEIKTSLHFIRSSASRMDSLLSSLLKLSRTGRTFLNIGEIDMNALMESLIDSFEYRFEKDGVIVVKENLPDCEGDEIQVGQIFSNIIDNALKYCDPERPLRIDISGEIDGNRVVYKVEDNGLGIKKEHLDYIFDVFHRLNPNGQNGDGIGLSIVKRVTNRMNGSVWVESEPGKGSCFFVALPVFERNESK